MIIAYAQSTEKQGVDAASGGRMIPPEDAGFVALREKATGLNFSTTAHRVGDVEVRFGAKIVRLDVVQNADGTANESPVVVVADIADLAGGIDRAARVAVDSVAAIGRIVGPASIAAGFEEGERLHHSFRIKRYVATAAAAALMAALAIWVSRGAPGPWSR